VTLVQDGGGLVAATMLQGGAPTFLRRIDGTVST